MRKTMFFQSLSLLFVLTNTTAFAGGWGSSGGELLGDTQNPWWVKNTKTVNYCVEIDQEGISASPEKIRLLIQKAIGLWKTEFSRNIDFVENGPALSKQFSYLGVGIQEFKEVPCSKDVDLRLQFGYRTLSLNQRLHIHHPEKYVGMTVRTSYDEVTLRGKGFILIGSDRGPKRFRGETIGENPWSTDTALFLVLVHELGHVFGVPHVGSEYSLMSEQGPEIYVMKPVLEQLKRVDRYLMDPRADLGFIFIPSESWNSCHLQNFPISELMKSFFSLPADTKCLSFDLDRKTKNISVSISDDVYGSKTPVGEITGSTYLAVSSSAVALKITFKQQVFPGATSEIGRLPGPFFVNIDAAGGTYHSLRGGADHAIHIQTTTDGISMYGVIDGKIVRLLYSLQQ
jgi:hypothetical protein